MRITVRMQADMTRIAALLLNVVMTVAADQVGWLSRQAQRAPLWRRARFPRG
jgi:hypothetical protein